MSNPRKSILFLTAVHGNEPIGVAALKKLDAISKRRKYNWLIANPRALAKDTRFIDVDMNRNAPGRVGPRQYEQRRVAEVLKQCRRYRYVIDIHGTPAKTGIFAIINTPTIQNLLLASALPIDRVVIWSSGVWQKSGPVTQFTNCGLEIECGPKTDRGVQRRLQAVLRLITADGIWPSVEQAKQQQWYRVVGPVPDRSLTASQRRRLREFTPLKMKSRTIIPLLVNRYPGIACYNLEPVDWWKQFAY